MPSGRIERVATIVVVVSTVWFAIALGWGLFGPIGGGHWAIFGSRGIMADNMVTWGIWGPVREYTLERPLPQEYYVHHPWGTYWVIGAFAKVLGRHAYVVRLEPILMSVACPPLLYRIGTLLYGKVAGVLAAVAYVVLPITLAFGNFPGFEGPLIFGCLVTTWGYLRFQQRWQRRWMAVSLAGVVWSVNCDWESCIFLGAVLGTLLVANLFLPRWFARVDARRFGQWWSLTVIITVLTVFAYVVYVKHVGNVDEFLNQEAKREKGNDASLGAVLAARRYWIDVTFTPVAIAIGKIALPIFLFRLLVLRRHLDVFPLALLLMATIQYVHFKNGADVHIFWSQPFAPYWALSLAVVGKTALDLARFTVARLDAFDVHVKVPRDAVELGVLGAIGLLPLLMLPDGVRGLAEARATGGRFNDRGRRIFQDLDKAAACAWMTTRMEPDTRVQIHASLHSAWEVDWALRRPTVGTDAAPTRLATGADRYFIGDLAFMKPGDQVKMAAEFHVVAVGQFVLIDRASPFAPADGYSFDLREPTPLEWYFVDGSDPVRALRPDPWYTWELRQAFGQAPNPVPDRPPQTLDELRIAHNAATAAGDSARAAELRKQIVNQLDANTATFTDGTQLLGERFTRGVAPALDLYFLAAGPAVADDIQFDIKSVVERPPLFSLVGADDKIKAVGMPFVIPPRIWKAGFIYLDHTEIRHRPGREAYSGFFIGGSDQTRPKEVDGNDLPLLTLR
jgi:Dolichyl-phosphate-mannose-protein mannosyltransferase